MADQDNTEKRLPDQSEGVDAISEAVTSHDHIGILSLISRATRDRNLFLYAIPVGVVLLAWIIFRPSTLETLKSLGSSLNGFSLNGAEYFSVGFAILGAVVMLLLTLSFLPDIDRARLVFMLELSGACLGWVLGMFFSPASQTEQQTFFNAKTAIVGIVSGYLLSKLQTVFDKAVADGKIFNAAALQYGLCFLIPLLLSAAAVYNVRAYQDMSVIITPGKGGDLVTTVVDGKTSYTLSLAKTATFIAEARFPNNTGVLWSIDPRDESHGTIDKNTGDYKAPSSMPNDPEVDVVAMSLSDKTKISRLTLTLKPPDSKADTASTAAAAKPNAPAKDASPKSDGVSQESKANGESSSPK